MAKDPAVLFYYSDFLTGTSFMTDEEVGQYIRLLCHQADKGRLTKKQVLSVCRANAIPESIQEKLILDENGLYYQKRMEEEKIKRSKYVESRRKSALSPKSVRNAYVERMEDANEDINADINAFKKFEHPTKEKVINAFTLAGYPEEEAKKFFGYYSSKDWIDARGNPIAYWSSLIEKWMLETKNFRSKDGTNKKDSPRGTIDFDKYEREREASKPRGHTGVVSDAVPKRIQ